MEDYVEGGQVSEKGFRRCVRGSFVGGSGLVVRTQKVLNMGVRGGEECSNPGWWFVGNGPLSKTKVG